VSGRNLEEKVKKGPTIPTKAVLLLEASHKPRTLSKRRKKRNGREIYGGQAAKESAERNVTLSRKKLNQPHITRFFNRAAP